MVAKVTLSPDALDARNSATWRLPSFYHADVQLILPILPERLPNATLWLVEKLGKKWVGCWGGVEQWRG